MSARLIRALQRGGSLARAKPEGWGVWRSRDLRGRQIGSLPDQLVANMLAEGQLKPLGGEHTECLVWAGPMASIPMMPAGGVTLTHKKDGAAAAGRQSLLARLLDTCTCEDRRMRLARAVRLFRDDMEMAQAQGLTGGMNWQALEAGQRIDGGRAQTVRAVGGSTSSKRVGGLTRLLLISGLTIRA